MDGLVDWVGIPVGRQRAFPYVSRTHACKRAADTKPIDILAVDGVAVRCIARIPGRMTAAMEYLAIAHARAVFPCRCFGDFPRKCRELSAWKFICFHNREVELGFLCARTVFHENLLSNDIEMKYTSYWNSADYELEYRYNKCSLKTHYFIILKTI